MLAQLALPVFLSLAAAPAGQAFTEKAVASPPLVNLPDFRPLIRASIGAVVNISVEQKPSHPRGWGGQGNGGNPNDPNDFFERFFGQRVPREFRKRGVGSGFVISADGYVLTNNHVVEGVDTIKVKFPDEISPDEFPAKVVGLDPRSDVALIKIEAKRTFPFLPLGDSSAIQVGDWVVAIGNPFGLAHSVSAGIVSAKDRRDIEPNGRSGLYDFIQTDASINPGNSGGPLINLRGEVIGINAAINAAGQGLGFAIPVNMVKPVLTELREKGRVTRSWIGVMIQRMDGKLAQSYGLERPMGAIVSEVVEGGPAARAGLQPGDVILDFDGKAIRESSDLQLLAAQAGINKTVTVTVLREGKRVPMKVTLGELPGEQEVLAGGGRSDADKDASLSLGLRISDITPDLRDRFDLKEKSGVLVADLDPAGAAADAGLRPGDVILKLNDKPVANAKQFASAARAAKTGDILRLHVRRGQGSLFIALSKP